MNSEPGRNQLRISESSHQALQGGYSLDFQNKQQSGGKEKSGKQTTLTQVG